MSLYEGELLHNCMFFNDRMANMPSTSEVIKPRYCQGDYAECARYAVREALGRDRVPEDLFPNRIDRARAMISKG